MPPVAYINFWINLQDNLILPENKFCDELNPISGEKIFIENSKIKFMFDG